LTEQQFTNELLKWLKQFRWRAFHVRNSGAGGMTQVQGDKGFPDILAIRPPRILVAELKVGKPGTLKGDPTPEQRAWLAAFDLISLQPPAAIETYVWYPQMFPAILEILAEGLH
jgi:hypothetical protein